MSAESADPLIHLTSSAENARTLLAFYRFSRREADLDDLARVRSVVEATEAVVATRLVSGAAKKSRLTDNAKLLTFALAPLASSAGVEKVSFDTALLKLSREQVPIMGIRSAAWDNLCTAAFAAHEVAGDLVREVMTRNQGGRGAATALDRTLIDETTLTRDPAGLERPLKNAELRERHALLREVAEQAVVEERGALLEMLEAIAAHVGSPDRFPLKRMKDEVEEAMDAAARAQLLGPQQEVDMLRATRLPKATHATAAVADGWAAVRAAENGLTLDALVRLGSVDVPMLRTLTDYLDRAGRVLAWSSAVAAEQIKTRQGGAVNDTVVVIRAVAEGLLDECKRLA